MASSRQANGNYVSLLMIACQQGNLHQIQELLATKPSNSATASVDTVLIVDKNGRSAVHYCAEYSRLECAACIVERIDEPTRKTLLDLADNEGFTALFIATINGNSAMLTLFLSVGAEVSLRDKELHTPVHWAVVCGHYECLELLLQQRAEASSADVHGAYPLHYAAQMPSDTSVSVTVSAAVAATNTAEAPRSSSTLRFLERLLEYGVEVDPLDADRRQPLLWAASSGIHQACSMLVKAGADVTVGDKDGLTALHCAASRGHIECVRLLIEECGTDVDVKDKHDCTPLMYSATLGFLDCIRYLGRLGASKDHQDRKGRSAAHLAASKGQSESIMELEELGGDIWLRNHRGDFPLHEAAHAGYIGVVEYLLSKFPQYVNAVNDNGRSCLHIAVMQNDAAMCQFLLESHQIDINLIMQNSKMQYFTALDLAMAKNNVEMIKYLRCYNAMESAELRHKGASLIQHSFLKRPAGSSRLNNDPNGILEEAFETNLRSTPTFQLPLDLAQMSSLTAPQASNQFESSQPGEIDGSMYPHLPREVTASPTEFDHLVTMERHSDYDAIMEASSSVLGRRISGHRPITAPVFEMPQHTSHDEHQNEPKVSLLKTQNSSTSIAQHEVSGNTRSGAINENTPPTKSVPKLEIEISIADDSDDTKQEMGGAISARSEKSLTAVFEMAASTVEAADVPSRSVSRSSLVKYESDSGSDEDMKHPDHRSNFMRKLMTQHSTFLSPKDSRKLTMSRSYNSLHPDDMDLSDVNPGKTGWSSARNGKRSSMEGNSVPSIDFDVIDLMTGSWQHPALLGTFPQDVSHDICSDGKELEGGRDFAIVQTDTVNPSSAGSDLPSSRQLKLSTSSQRPPFERVTIAVQTSARTTPRLHKSSETQDAGVSARVSNTSDTEVQTSARENYGSSWASDFDSSVPSSTPTSRHSTVSTDVEDDSPKMDKINGDRYMGNTKNRLEGGGEALARRGSRLRWEDSNVDDLHSAGYITSDHVSFRDPQTVTDVAGGQVRTSPTIREASDEDSNVAPEEYSTNQSLYNRFRPPTPRVRSLREVRQTLQFPARSRTTASTAPKLYTSLRHRDAPPRETLSAAQPKATVSSTKVKRMLDAFEPSVQKSSPLMPTKFVSSFNNTVLDIAPHSVIIKYLHQLQQMQKKDTKYNQSVVLAKVIPKYFKEMEKVGKLDKFGIQEDVAGKTKTFKDWQHYLLRKLHNLSSVSSSPVTDMTDTRSRTESDVSTDIWSGTSGNGRENDSSSYNVVTSAASTKLPTVSALAHPFPWR